jgi:mRNA interferase MazF
MVKINRFEVWNTQLNPTVGSEIRKIRPCVIVSPDEINKYLNTVTIAPLTSTQKKYPTRVFCTFQGKQGQVAIDQVRTIDKSRLISKLGELDQSTSKDICSVLVEYFKYKG